MATPDPLAHARDQAEFHAEQVRVHSEKARKWEQFIALHAELFGETNGEQPASVASPVRQPASQRSAATTGAIAETRAISNMILEDARDYVPTGELLDKLTEFGIEIGGISPASTLSARLSGDDEITSKRGRGYILKKFLQFADAAGSLLDESPAASTSTPNSADEDGREVAHDNMSH